jgi:hypothetical protein
MNNDEVEMDGNDLFDFAANCEISDTGREADAMIRSFIRSALDPGLLDPNLKPENAEYVITLMNLLNAIRWFQEVNKERR